MAKGAGLRAKGTGRRAQGAGRRAQGIGRRAKRNRALKELYNHGVSLNLLTSVTPCLI